MKIFTIKPLEWLETHDGLFVAKASNDYSYEVCDNEKFPPTSHDGRRYLTPPAKGFCACGDNMEGSFHETADEAKAACQADWEQRIAAALVEVSAQKGDFSVVNGES